MAYTTINDPSAHFQIKLYTGNGSARSLTNDGNSDLQADWIWIKERNNAVDHQLQDSSRGVTKTLQANSDNGESTLSDIVTAFNSDGFSLGNNASWNGNNDTYVAWQWKANGGTTTTNDASSTGVGTIDSVIQANTTAGFSIITHTGSGSAGNIAHGLGVAPEWVLTKNRTDDGQSWANYHVGVGNGYYLELDTTDAKESASSVWGDTTPSSTTFRVGGANGKNNASSKNYVSYCFTPIQGYSKFGKYTGNGAEPGGASIYTGFKPAWFIIHASSENGQAWVIGDSARDPSNLAIRKLFANNNAIESAAVGDNNWDFLSNGFKVKTQDDAMNKNGTTYFFMAFAESPFVSSEGVPTTAK